MPPELEVRLPEISIKAEPVFDIALPWGGHFAITNSMVYTLLVIAALALFFWWATRRMNLVPRGSQNIAEAVVEFLLGVTEGTAGRRVGRRIFPLIATLFIFIITANYAGLLPGVGTIGYCSAPHTEEAQVLNVKTAAPALAQEGEASGGGLPAAECTYKDEAGASHEGVFIPYLRAPNADINTTLAMALLAVGVVQVAGIAAHGAGGYLKELMTPLWLAPIHIVGELSRVISLSFRLFGNIFGGEVLVTVMYVLLGSIFIGFGTFIFLGLELLFGFIQALVFSTLTLVYIATAVGGHGTNGGGHGEEAHVPVGPAEELGHQAAALLTGRSEASGPKIEGTEPETPTERHMG
jgi:F-type H+-transporting ATPase subunit a